MEIKINKTPEGILSYPCHSHRQYEVMYYTRGEGVMRTEDGDIPFSEGTVIIIPPKLSHGSFSERGFENISIECGFEGRFAFDSPVVIQGSLDDDGAKLAELYRTKVILCREETAEGIRITYATEEEA
jgi:hypothetical protein